MTEPLTPPTAPVRPTSTTVHGDTRVDDYGWLRDLEDPATIAYLEAENAYTEAELADQAPIRELLFEEIKSRIVETDLSVPVRKGPWWYYARTVEGQSYPIHCRRPALGDTPPSDDDDAGDEQVLYDENLEAQGHEFFSVGVLSVSPDHSTLAVATDTVGNERYSLSFQRLDGTASTSESIDNVSYGFAWASDSVTCFFTRVDDAWRPHQLWRHRVGDDPINDALVVEEPDARFNIGVGRSRDGAVLVVSISSSTTTETSFIDANQPDQEPQMLCPRTSGVEHGIEHLTTRDGAQWWLKVTNEDDALDFRLDVSPHVPGSQPTFATLVPHRPGVRLEGVDGFRSFLVLSERFEASTHVRVVPIDHEMLALGGDVLEASWLIGSESQPATTWLGSNPEPDPSTLRFGQTSLVMPSIVAQVDLADRTITVLKRQVVPGGYDESRFVTFRDWAIAADGTRVPISVVHRASLLAPGAAPGGELQEPAPCLLYGYGAYEISIDPSFSPTRLILLERGVVFAIAHVRGGGELGRRWYDEGHLEAKPNSFDDFVAVADHLIERGVTTRDRLAARGGSAGGLLMGAVANRAGDRFAALLAEVPFVDALSTMLDPSLPLTVGEYEEWGNPTDDPVAYETIKSYAPYENVSSTNPDGTDRVYPAMLLTGGLNDTRVGFWEPAKFAAKLRSTNPRNQVLLKTEMGVGHGGPSGRYDAWREEAFVVSWLLMHLGVSVKSNEPPMG